MCSEVFTVPQMHWGSKRQGFDCPVAEHLLSMLALAGVIVPERFRFQARNINLMMRGNLSSSGIEA